MQITWWAWLSIGILLLLAEALTPGGFYLFFIGLAAVCTGVAALIFPWLSLIKELCIFMVLLTFLITFVRKRLVDKVKQSTPQADKQEFVGESARTLEPIAVGQEGRVEVRGSVWQARNNGQDDLPSNAPCTVVKRDGLKFVVESKKG